MCGAAAGKFARFVLSQTRPHDLAIQLADRGLRRNVLSEENPVGLFIGSHLRGHKDNKLRLLHHLAGPQSDECGDGLDPFFVWRASGRAFKYGRICQESILNSLG